MRLFSTEQVSKYHPDKLSDQISDTILTKILEQDKNAQCGIETMIKGSTVVLGGEVTTTATVDYYKIISEFMSKMRQPFTRYLSLLTEQSPEIRDAVVKSDNEFGAGDQGMMYGYACNETPSLLPYGFDLANKIIRAVEEIAESGLYFKGDAKCQVTVDLDKKGVDSIHTIIVSVCQTDSCTLDTAKSLVKSIIMSIIGSNIEHINIIVNPGGSWTIGGAEADCGLTGRKIVCDQYGGYCPVGGGALSGKNPTKVDRSAAYMARYLAKYVVRHFNASSCEIQLAYGIGIKEPVGISLKTNLSNAEDEYITNLLLEKFDLTPKGIIDYLRLLNVDYAEVSAGCHYRNENYPWEQI